MRSFFCFNAVHVFLELDLAFHCWNIQMEVLASHSAVGDHLVHTVFWVSLILSSNIETQCISGAQSINT